MSEETEKSSIIELIGLIVCVIVVLFILSLPGNYLYSIKKDELRVEVINDLCNKSKGIYDFCKLDTITYFYVENIKKEDK